MSAPTKRKNEHNKSEAKLQKNEEDLVMPKAIRGLRDVEFDPIEFEVFEEFLSAKGKKDWVVGWLSNHDYDASELKMFGQDIDGGMAAIWMIRAGKDVLDQPVVFFGSDGDSVVASNFSDFLWLLAQGEGPYEASFGAESGDHRPYAVQTGEGDEEKEKEVSGSEEEKEKEEMEQEEEESEGEDGLRLLKYAKKYAKTPKRGITEIKKEARSEFEQEFANLLKSMNETN
eukprot:TRINITY_DN9605_c0_g1_i1.p1 TRINITY_DN9605_c0_g1~~TRINITY_DN9605_c0_g1_i1.p1  ORF type:complete len:229 (+),score=92.25 TRINITY_DN9605_c0_g1_i1:28-714(+)